MFDFLRDVHKIYRGYLVERWSTYKLMQLPNIEMTGHTVVVEIGTKEPGGMDGFNAPQHPRYFARVEPRLGDKDYMVLSSRDVSDAVEKIHKLLRRDGYAVGEYNYRGVGLG